MATHANALVVMAKSPIAGEVKTRLVPPLSSKQASDLCRCLLLDLLKGLRSFGEADLYVAFTPTNAAGLFEQLVPSGFSCFPQRGKELGERMKHVFEDLFGAGHRNIVIIGSDIPVFPVGFLRQAFADLDEAGQRVVLGPSRDGGYYLIGLGRLVPEIFTDIPWGTGRVLLDTAEKLFRLGVEVLRLPVWFDVDTIEDLRLLESKRAIWADALPRTFSLLQEFDFRQVLSRRLG
jgi:rSAM/selenodomain-associated transferase 1